MNKYVIVQIDEITEMLYQQKTTEAYEMLGEFIALLMNELKMGKLKIEKIDEFNKVLLNAINAMENKDEVLLADVLTYELKEYFE